jgi:hypothetical protein
VENAIRHKQKALAVFINIKGAFDIRTAAESRQKEPDTVEWIIAMLECRIVTAQLGQD